MYVREVCKGLSRQGIATEVFTMASDGGPVRVEPLTALSRIVHLPVDGEIEDKYALLREAPAFARRVSRLIDAFGHSYDAVYSHYWLSGSVVLSLRQDLAVPWIHTAHTLGAVKNRSLAPGASREPEERLRVEREIASLADLQVVSTQAEGEALVGEYGADRGRLAVVPPGVDLDVFRPRLRSRARSVLGRQGQRYFLFVGRLERLKGVEIALRAFRMAADRRFSATRLVVVGEDSDRSGPSERERLLAVARDLGIESRVDFLGSVPQGELALWYAGAEACVIPSYSESFGLVGLEAQACGTPVIASNLPGLASVVREGVTGFLIEGPDASTYAERMGRLLADPELSATMGRRGILLAQRFNWERTALALVERLRELRSAQEGVQASAVTE